jgi:hypothetical protein
MSSKSSLQQEAVIIGKVRAKKRGALRKLRGALVHGCGGKEMSEIENDWRVVEKNIPQALRG